MLRLAMVPVFVTSKVVIMKLTDIREGTTKHAVAKVFLDTKGDREACVKKGTKLGVQESTVRTWCSSWANGKKASPPKKAKAPAKSAKKAAPKKAAKREKLAA